MKHVVSFTGPVILCFAVGLLLDRRFETAPWFMLGGLVLGFITGLVSILRLLNEPPSDG
ncbi:MAG: AtpZ/AtpI family protein [Candidatus Sericytochromatia bacterium]|nr:AtpZ/AtpI family protein [Candidatus Tanganyikabacteria bacterium]